MKVKTTEPVAWEDLVSAVGEGIHRGLRKATGGSSHYPGMAWTAIDNMPDHEWSAALEFMLLGLIEMGLLSEEEEGQDE